MLVGVAQPPIGVTSMMLDVGVGIAALRVGVGGGVGVEVGSWVAVGGAGVSVGVEVEVGSSATGGAGVRVGISATISVNGAPDSAGPYNTTTARAISAPVMPSPENNNARRAVRR